MDVMLTIISGRLSPITLALGTDRTPTLYVTFTSPTSGSLHGIRFQIQARIFKITRCQVAASGNADALIFSLASPPEVRRDMGNMHNSLSEAPDYWSRQKALQRHTSLVPSSATALFPSIPINFGRWLTFAIDVPTASRNLLESLYERLAIHNIRVKPIPAFTFRPPQNREMSHILRSKIESTGVYGSFPDMLEALHSDNISALDFEARFLLEACVSQNIIYEGTFTAEFIGRLIMHPQSSRTILENALMDSRQRRFYDAQTIFTVEDYRSVRKCRIPDGSALVYTATITPLTIRLNVPSIEITNRVMRHFKQHLDRFLRVRFADEDGLTLRVGKAGMDDEPFSRVHHTLTRGLAIAGRHYEFLAFGNSQFREHGAYFFASTRDVSVDQIRAWMGKFDDIKQVARYASRIGQCFSTTRAVSNWGSQLDIELIPDIQRNGYTFTDGVGKVSPFLASMIAQHFGVGTAGHYPSAFQFRMGGDKGILVVVPSGDKSCQGRTVQVRNSQRKFAANSILEIIRYSTFSTAYLNSQIILVLASLGVPRAVFQTKLRRMLTQLNDAMHDDQVAIRTLRANIDINQVTSDIANFITSGLSREPFVRGILKLWRAWSTKYLKEKFKILIEDSAFVLGCVDETATLTCGPSLPQIFLQIPEIVSDRRQGYRIVTGRCLLARNPSLHPGDIRVVEAVDCLQLRHLKNVVVLPQTGDRPLANMCAGGDLDGDDYMVIWDQDMVPPEQDHAPMEYVESRANNSAPVDKVTTAHIIDFFVEYMKNNSLGQIAIAHRVWADKSMLGVKDPKCLTLAALHSQAVDYAKSGVPARMSQDLYVKEYPHWMNRPAHQKIYQSTGVLGMLYDDVERVEFSPACIDAHTFCDHIIAGQKFDAADLEFATQTKRTYDEAVTRVMTQFGLGTEFEAFTAFAMEVAPGIRDYEVLQDIGSVMSNIKNDVRESCYAYLGTKLQLPKHECNREHLGTLVRAMYKITKDEYEKMRAELTENQRYVFISLPFVFTHEICEISKRSLEQGFAVPVENGRTHDIATSHASAPVICNVADMGQGGPSIEPSACATSVSKVSPSTTESGKSVAISLADAPANERQSHEAGRELAVESITASKPGESMRRLLDMVD